MHKATLSSVLPCGAVPGWWQQLPALPGGRGHQTPGSIPTSSPGARRGWRGAGRLLVLVCLLLTQRWLGCDYCSIKSPKSAACSRKRADFDVPVSRQGLICLPACRNLTWARSELRLHRRAKGLVQRSTQQLQKGPLLERLQFTHRRLALAPEGRVFHFPAASHSWMTGAQFTLLGSSSQAAQHLLGSKQLQHAVFVAQLMATARRSESPESRGWSWRTAKWGHSEEALEMQDTAPCRNQALALSCFHPASHRPFGHRRSWTHAHGVVGQDPAHAAGAVLDGDGLAGGLVRGGQPGVEAFVADCRGRRGGWSQR